MGTWSIWHWLVVLLVIILVFGTSKLKNIGKDLGGAIKGFRDAMSDDKGKKGEPERLDAQADAQQREATPTSAEENHKNP